MNVCPLCSEINGISLLRGPVNRSFLHCENCFLIFTESKDHPSADSERDRYLTHNNCIENKGYVAFLNKAVKPAMEFIKPGMKGLDYGCGPVPVLSLILENSGLDCDNYDPLFYPDLNREKQYDFIFAIECSEHFFYPEKEFNQIKNLLKPRGILILMTELWNNISEFKSWWYARDFTHVTFYHQETLKYISKRYDLTFLFRDGKSISIFRNSY